MLNIKKWLETKSNIARKTAGLEEKNEATALKIKVARSILDRRIEPFPVEEERRHELYDYHHKLA